MGPVVYHTCRRIIYFRSDVAGWLVVDLEAFLLFILDFFHFFFFLAGCWLSRTGQKKEMENPPKECLAVH